MKHAALFALLAAILATACTVEVPVEHPELIGTTPAMTRSESCLETECDRAQREWQSGWACTSCISDCVISGGSYSSCRSYCQYTCVLHCDQASSPCAGSRYSFQVSAERDDLLASACEVANEHARSCGSDGSTDCDIVGRTRTPAMRDHYACLAAASCNSTPSCSAPPVGTLGDEWFAASQRLCTSSSATTRLLLNNGQGTLRDDVIGALRGCFVLSTCDDLDRCTMAWRATVGM